jgi:hypothetical protein
MARYFAHGFQDPSVSDIPLFDLLPNHFLAVPRETVLRDGRRKRCADIGLAGRITALPASQSAQQNSQTNCSDGFHSDMQQWYEFALLSMNIRSLRIIHDMNFRSIRGIGGTFLRSLKAVQFDSGQLFKMPH